MKRYIVYAKRKDEKKWTPWVDTNDINAIERYVNRVRELGYEAKVDDPTIRELEKKRNKGYLLKTPVRIGQTVYAVIEDEEPRVEEWVVKALHYDGKVWYAIDDTDILYDVGSQWCLTTPAKVEKFLKELKGEHDV